jgi:5-formyltetrahydrofolate cyclo-ligase
VSIADAKSKLRQRLGEAIHSRPEITAQVLRLPEWQQAAAVVLFASIGHEPDTRHLLIDAWRRKKPTFATRVDDTCVTVPTQPATLWRLGQYRVPEPLGDAVTPPPKSLVIVPGVAFSRTGQRLGRGGGHYDRLLASLVEPVAVGICSDERLLDDLPVEPHDRRMDVIVTPTQVVRPPQG